MKLSGSKEVAGQSPGIVLLSNQKGSLKRQGATVNDQDRRYVPPHAKRRRVELAEWRRRLEEEETEPAASRPSGPNIRALAKKFEGHLERPGACGFNPLQCDEGVQVTDNFLQARCTSTSTSSTGLGAAMGVKGLPLVGGGRYQYEVELLQEGALAVGWSAATVLPSYVCSGGPRRMMAYASSGTKIGATVEGEDDEVVDYGAPFGKLGDVVGALLDWSSPRGPKLSFVLNGQRLGAAFDLSRGAASPPLQLHVCQGLGPPLHVMLRGASPEVKLRFPISGFKPLGEVADSHFCAFSEAVRLASAADTAPSSFLRRAARPATLLAAGLETRVESEGDGVRPPPAAARRLIHTSLGIQVPLAHLAQERILSQAARGQ